ncbi:hypothetical protein PVAP13_1KG526300, partial [Panicum virgatum]
GNHFTTLLFSKTGKGSSPQEPNGDQELLPSHPFLAIPSFGTRKATATVRFSTAVHSSREHLPNSTRSIKTVFEDQVRGVVCYRDDRGEMVCEGYDEGPRLGMRLPEKACFPW